MVNDKTFPTEFGFINNSDLDRVSRLHRLKSSRLRGSAARDKFLVGGGEGVGVCAAAARAPDAAKESEILRVVRLEPRSPCRESLVISSVHPCTLLVPRVGLELEPII